MNLRQIMTTANEGLMTKFINLDKKKRGYIGMVIAFVVGLLLLYFGIGAACGFFLVGLLIYLIPHYMGAEDVRVMTIFGVVFMLVAVAFGTFAVSMPMIEAGSEPQTNETFTDVDVVYEDGVLTFTAETPIDTTSGGKNQPYVHYNTVMGAGYYVVNIASLEYEHIKLTETSSDSTKTYWKATKEVEFGTLGLVYLDLMTTSEDGKLVPVEKTDTYKFYIDESTDKDHIQSLCLFGNAYSVVMIMIVFFIILFATFIMRKVIENARVKMEAEGRLYPQGYGACKKCGAVVLPGEVCCRKCGEYIEVPEEIKHKKVEWMECSDCGAEVPADAVVCPKCGASFDDEEENPENSKYIVCSECGAEVPSDFETCPRCGKKMQ